MSAQKNNCTGGFVILAGASTIYFLFLFFNVLVLVG